MLIETVNLRPGDLVFSNVVNGSRRLMIIAVYEIKHAPPLSRPLIEVVYNDLGTTSVKSVQCFDTFEWEVVKIDEPKTSLYIGIAAGRYRG